MSGPQANGDSTAAALGILEKERRAVRRAHRFLQRSLVTFVGLLALFVVLGSEASPVLGRSGWRGENALQTTIVAGFLLTFLGLLPALSLAWAGLVRSTFRMARGPRWLVRALDRVEWATAVSALGRVRRRTLLTGLGAFLGLPLLMLAAIVLVVWLEDRGATGLIVVIALFGTAAALILPDALMRGRDVRRYLEEIGRLAGPLGRLPTAGAGEGLEHPLSARDWNRVVRMERAQNARERAHAVAEGLRERASEGYSVVKSPSLVEALASLEPSLRMRIEEEADALGRAPHREDALVLPASGHRRLRVPDTSVELCYAIEEDRHRVRLEAIEDASDA